VRAALSLHRLFVNGEEHALAVAAQRTLLEALRYDLGLTGSKQGCEQGRLRRLHGPRPRRAAEGRGDPILSCITLAQDAQDLAITTIEGLAGPQGLDPVQRAFADCGALQCGFCQPGMMISARALLDHNPKPTLPQIQEALSGNLCRCTGYTKIYESRAGRRGPARPRPARARAVRARRAQRFEGAGGQGDRPMSIGARFPKQDGVAKADGSGIYADDIALPRMLQRKDPPLPARRKQRIRGIDLSAAEALPWRGGYAGRRGAAAQVRRHPLDPGRDGARRVEKVRHVGDAVAWHRRGRRADGGRGAEAGEGGYEVLPAVFTREDALEHPEIKVNERAKVATSPSTSICNSARSTKRWKGPHGRGARDLPLRGSTHVPIEPHCAVARIDADGNLHGLELDADPALMCTASCRACSGSHRARCA